MYNASFFVLMAWLLPIHFEENDDAVMCMVANGVFSGTPDGHLIFINSLYGWLIAGLYQLTKVVEWYTLGFAIMHVLAMTGISYLVIKERRIIPFMKGVFLLFMYVLWASIIVRFQFTTTAGLLCFSGCLALLQPSRKWRIVGVGAVFIASLIRFHAAGLVGLMCAPMMLVEFVNEKRYAFWVLVTVFLVLFGSFADGLFYLSPDWAEARAYNAVRGQINDNPNVPLLSESDLPEGINMDDLNMLYWHQVDPKVMTLPKMQEINAKLDSHVLFQTRFSNVNQVKSYRKWFVLLGVGCFISLLLRWPKNKERMDKMCFYSLLLSVILFVGSTIWICVDSTLKFRVILCMLIPLSFQMIFDLPQLQSSKKIICCVLLSLIQIILSYYLAREVKRSTKSCRFVMNEYVEMQEPLLKGQNSVIYPAGLGIGHISPFKLKDFKARLVAYVWLTKSPFNKGIFEGYDDFVNHDLVYFWSADRQPPVEINKGLEKNYGIKVSVETVASNNKHALYRFKPI